MVCRKSQIAMEAVTHHRNREIKFDQSPWPADSRPAPIFWISECHHTNNTVSSIRAPAIPEAKVWFSSDAQMVIRRSRNAFFAHLRKV